MTENLYPAFKIITELGGVSEVSEITSVHITRVYCWMKSKERGGTGGTIPQKHIPTLMKAANDRGLNISAENFLPQETTQ